MELLFLIYDKRITTILKSWKDTPSVSHCFMWVTLDKGEGSIILL